MAMLSYSTDKKTIERGDIFYVESMYNEEGSEQKSGRPAIIVSNDIGNKNGPIVEVVYLTTAPKNDMPTHVTIRSSTKPSTALCEQITTVAKTRLGSFVAQCTEAEMKNVEIACAISLGIELGNSTVKEVVGEKPVPAPTVDNSEIIRAAAERDVYKNLYEGLLSRVTRRLSE